MPNNTCYWPRELLSKTQEKAPEWKEMSQMTDQVLAQLIVRA